MFSQVDIILPDLVVLCIPQKVRDRMILYLKNLFSFQTKLREIQKIPNFSVAFVTDYHCTVYLEVWLFILRFGCSGLCRCLCAVAGCFCLCVLCCETLPLPGQHCLYCAHWSRVLDPCAYNSPCTQWFVCPQCSQHNCALFFGSFSRITTLV